MEKKYSVKSCYVLREIAGEYLAVPVGADAGGKIIVLNPVSGFIWKFMETPKTVEEITAAVTADFDVAADIAKADILEFLSLPEMQDALIIE